MEFQKIANFLKQHLMIKIYQDLLLKSGLKFMINQKKITALTKKSELKCQCYDFSDAHIVAEGDITLEGDNDANKQNKNFGFKKTLHHSLTAFQKLMA